MIAPRGPKPRLDVLLVERGLAPSRARAQALVMAGLVDVNGVRVDKAGTTVPFDAAVQVRSSGSAYVSRGGEKLAGALASFEPHGLKVQGVVAADFGASTGGFVDCLLQHGAARVHAIDVGHGLLHERLRGDERVVVWERTNARHVTTESIGESVGLVVIDASFIGLSKLLGAVREVLREGGELVALIKPQFEAGRREVARGRGVIRDDEVRANVIRQVLDQVSAEGFDVIADAACVITGPKGNREHFVYARKR
jgi:23S rRNA (cytidine1920-2'-O)/16S rRNA (cytidine1409-2'-O)-methyltransferase